VSISLAVLPGCDGLNPYKIGERSIERYLYDYIGPAENYDIHIHREGTNLRRGLISHLTVSADDLTTKSGFHIRRIDADLYGVRFNRRAKRVDSVESSVFIAHVTEESANRYLAAHDRGIPGLNVEFRPVGITVHAAPKLLGVSIPVTLIGTGTAQGGSLIHFNPDAVAVSRLNLPMAAVRLVEQRINPVFDLNDLKLPARLTSVESGTGEILLRGEVRLH
jgi:hypothetical protein